ncbi:hypothetical protein P7H15_04725 [Paenibacillus larvae]|nr:hypothetical protein [Paenibacillus larvae]MDT2292352.1 hypothetical protein [Paenibacillus larvae]
MNTQIENNFKYHAPKPEQTEKYTAIREKAKELAYLVDDLCPNSREITGPNKFRASSYVGECCFNTELRRAVPSARLFYLNFTDDHHA